MGIGEAKRMKGHVIQFRIIRGKSGQLTKKTEGL